MPIQLPSDKLDEEFCSKIQSINYVISLMLFCTLAASVRRFFSDSVFSISVFPISVFPISVCSRY
jgi:hypothetical protein